MRTHAKATSREFEQSSRTRQEGRIKVKGGTRKEGMPKEFRASKGGTMS